MTTRPADAEPTDEVNGQPKSSGPCQARPGLENHSGNWEGVYANMRGDCTKHHDHVKKKGLVPASRAWSHWAERNLRTSPGPSSQTRQY